MISFFDKIVNQRVYKSVYGRNAKITIKEDIVEVTTANMKIIHNKETGIKIEEMIYNANEVTIYIFDEEVTNSYK